MINDIAYLLVIAFGGCWGVIYFKQCNNTYKVLTTILVLTFVSELISTILSYQLKNNSLPQKIYTPIHILAFTIIYFTLLKKFKLICLILGSVVLVFAIISIILSNKNELPSYIVMIDSCMLVLFSIVYFTELIRQPFEENILSSESFWLNTGVLIYFTGTFLFWLSFSFLLSNYKKVLIDLVNIMDNYFDPFLYLLLNVALVLHIRNKKRISDGKR